MVAIVVDDGEAAAVDGDAGGDGQLVGERGGVDGELASGRAGFQAGDGAEMFDDAGEHELTIADSSGESKTCQYAVQGAKNRQPYYNLVRFAIAGISGRKMEEKDEP